MAKENSFDIVSEVDMQEVDNAVNQALREISNRYDLKSTKTELTFDKGANRITVMSENDFTLKSAVDVLQSKMVRRQISLKALRTGKVEAAAGGRARQYIDVQTGISEEISRKIVRLFKDQKLKVQARTEGEKVRVSGKSRDVLQDAIQMVKGEDWGIPMQFVNYR